jgi:GNAT superfamily N-acetyltransferase
VGTITAWRNADYRSAAYGRVHWVAIVPAFQGRGLARPLLAACLRRLSELGYGGAYLTTSPPRLAAINLYLRFGFTPDVQSVRDAEAWRLLADRVKPEFRQTVLTAAT